MLLGDITKAAFPLLRLVKQFVWNFDSGCSACQYVSVKAQVTYYSKTNIPSTMTLPLSDFCSPFTAKLFSLTPKFVNSTIINLTELELKYTGSCGTKFKICCVTYITNIMASKSSQTIAYCSKCGIKHTRPVGVRCQKDHLLETENYWICLLHCSYTLKDNLF